MAKLLRLTCYNNKEAIFINPEDVCSLQMTYDYAVNSFMGISATLGPNITNTTHPNPRSNGRTVVQLRNGSVWHIREHIEIVAALVEGKDPSPATILYGEVNGNESK